MIRQWQLPRASSSLRRWLQPVLAVGAVGLSLAILGLQVSAEGATAPRELQPRLRFELPTVGAMFPFAPLRLVEPAPTRVPVLDDTEFAAALADDVLALGSVSIGKANRGQLWNGVSMPSSPRWIIAEPKHSFGTSETVQAIAHAIDAVNQLYPDTPPLYVGHLSHERGGWLKPHRSHQSGRDVDLGFYYRGGPRWYVRATPENFDVERNWALLAALLKTGPVEYVFVDGALHPLLRAHAEAIGEPADFLLLAFDGVRGRTEPLIRHARGHDDHIHVRFESTVAVENGKRVRAVLGGKAPLWTLLHSRAQKQAKARARAAQ